MAITMTDRATVEIRRNDDGSIDEVVADAKFVHIEQMSDDGWYIGIDAADGHCWQFWLGAKNRRSRVELRHTEIYRVDGEGSKNDAD